MKDIKAIHSIFSDSETMGFWPSPFSAKQSTSWVEINAQRHLLTGMGRWVVELKSSGKLIGDAGIIRTSINGTEENDLGYIISAKHWKKGYGFEASKAVFDYGFNHLNLDRLCANMPVDHNASRSSAEKLGMSLEKEFRNEKNRSILTCLYAAASSYNKLASKLK
jgi:ribosomal-protein-alanine N-acetyltransferase